ncbi:MAG: hypothetical protein HYT38_02755 [Candidatus Sungbacteria bacterium]|uniref:Uncharacterized protein n=1 Tax=Candidatus Sungiibacteriota bacterium TaxID=2750080 RepID=A0A9D6HU47_9BACT|nr:hypothetical protein [Candidatus Sungbacteria bacterium]
MNPEQQREVFLEHLQNEIWQAAQEMGVELTEEELKVAWQGPRTEEEKWVPFKLGDREARLSVRAMDFPEDSQDRRVAGAQALILKAAACLRGAPKTSAECLQYARDVWEGKYVWDEKDIPQTAPRTEEIEVEEDARKAA